MKFIGIVASLSTVPSIFLNLKPFHVSAIFSPLILAGIVAVEPHTSKPLWKMEKQNLFFENHEMQDEIRKLNDEIHRLTTELSETQKLNQLLQKNNDDLRNRNGLKSRSEQELLEEEIKDVRDQNSKLQIQVNKSSVQAVDEAYRKQKGAEKQLQSLKYQAEQNRKTAEKEVQKLKKG